MSKSSKQTYDPTAVEGESASNPQETTSGSKLMQTVLAKPSKAGQVEASSNERINGVVIGYLSEAGEQGQVMVYFPGIPKDEPLAAISTEDLSDKKPGDKVALGFVNGNPAQPIVLGLIQNPFEDHKAPEKVTDGSERLDVLLDGDKLTFRADREIVLQCGKSSITLTRAGKIILKGAYLSNHSTGVNRIKGGSVQIN